MGLKTLAAVVRKNQGPFSFEEVVLDDVRADEIYVRMLACGICHTDIAVRNGMMAFNFRRAWKEIVIKETPQSCLVFHRHLFRIGKETRKPWL